MTRYNLFIFLFLLSGCIANTKSGIHLVVKEKNPSCHGICSIIFAEKSNNGAFQHVDPQYEVFCRFKCID